MITKSKKKYHPSPADWRDHVLYMVMIDRFANGDKETDNYNGNYNPDKPNGVHGGDLKGITQKLDYLQSLGITALWLSPVPTNNGQYHGYAAVHLKQVDPRIGTMKDLQELIAQAHARGIYVFLDIVCNHMGFYIKHPRHDWNYPKGYKLAWADGKRYSPAPFDKLSAFHNHGNIHNFHDRKELELGWFHGLNDIKTEDVKIQNALIDIYKWWIRKTDCDGFRIDTFKHVNIEFWQAFCPAIRDYAATLGKKDFLMIGEIYDEDDAKVGYYTGTKAGGSYVLKSALHYPLYYVLNKVFAHNQSTRLLDDTISQMHHYDATSHDYLATFIDNHDNARFLAPSRANNDHNKLKLALTYLLTSRGIPVIYYGTEQGFHGENDPYCREDMFAGQFKNQAFEGQDSFNPQSPLFQFTSSLISLRKQYLPLRRGTFVPRMSNPKSAGIYAYSRIYQDQEIVVILNTAITSQTTRKRKEGLQTGFPKNTLLINLLNTGENFIVGKKGLRNNQISVTLPPQSMKILSPAVN